ncbi:MAG: DUF4231 domain-containing protein [bacterium]|nr:DUF4231 domain-containing protein [bacterium]
MISNTERNTPLCSFEEEGGRMSEDSQIHCPYCKEWKNIDGSQPPREIASMFVLFLIVVCIYLASLIYKIGHPDGVHALFIGTGIMVSLIVIITLLVEIFRKREKWYAFLDGKEQFHLHDEDPLHGLTWRRWRCENDRGEPNPLIQFSPSDPDECIVRMDDQEVSCLVRVVLIPRRDLILEDTDGNRISGRGIKPKNPPRGLLEFIRRHLTVGDMLRHIDGTDARILELQDEISALQERRERDVKSDEKMPDNVIQIFPGAKERGNGGSS